MTREEVFAAMTTMQYWLNGERIQVSGPCGSWVDVADNEFPSWDWSSYRWRVKPHTVAPRGCSCCDPTHDSPDPVVVRLQAQVERLHTATETVNEAFNEMLAFKDAKINQLQDQLVTERGGLAKVIEQRDEARADVTRLKGELQKHLIPRESLDELYSIANLTKEVGRLNDLLADRGNIIADMSHRLTECQDREEKSRNERDDNAHVIIEAGVIPGCDYHCRCEVCRRVVKAMDEAGFIRALETDERWWDESEVTP